MTLVATPPRRDRAKLYLKIQDASRIIRRLLGQVNGQGSAVGFVCSESWAYVCLHALESGRVQIRKKNQHLERDLHKARVYPPGGSGTTMIENTRTLRWMPPDYTGEPLDEREDVLTLVQGCKLPRSVSAVNLDAIRMLKARVEKKQAKTSRR